MPKNICPAFCRARLRKCTYIITITILNRLRQQKKKNSTPVVWGSQSDEDRGQLYLAPHVFSWRNRLEYVRKAFRICAPQTPFGQILTIYSNRTRGRVPYFTWRILLLVLWFRSVKTIPLNTHMATCFSPLTPLGKVRLGQNKSRALLPQSSSQKPYSNGVFLDQPFFFFFSRVSVRYIAPAAIFLYRLLKKKFKFVIV